MMVNYHEPINILCWWKLLQVHC